MASRIIKQPSGQYARFCTIVDHFTHCNLTCVEMWRLLREVMDCEKAVEKVSRADADPRRFDEAIEIIGDVHGPLEAEWTRAYLTGHGSGVPPPGLRSVGEEHLVADINAHEKYLAMLDPALEENGRWIEQYSKLIRRNKKQVKK